MYRVLLVLALGVLSLNSVSAAEPAAPAPAPAKKHFLYVLRLMSRLYDDKAWTPADGEIVGRHFERLKAATATGQVILAGRTTEAGDKTMGLVIFEAVDETAARAFMVADPAVAEGVMTATLHPYAVALRAK